MSLKTRAASNNQRAREAMLEYNLHEHDIKFMLDYFDGRCAYCGIILTNETFNVDHIIPISEEDEDIINYGSVAYNIIPSCEYCNSLKGVSNYQEWIQKTFDNHFDIIYKINEYQIRCGIDTIIW